MKKLNGHTVGLICGTFLGLFHTVWALLVSGEVAQKLLNWVYEIHFLNNPFRVATFDLTTAVVLVAVTSVVGYCAGWVFAAIWNNVMKK
jgi:hypothetical protein